MKIKQIFQLMVIIGLVHCFAFADNLTNDPNLRVLRQGDYTFTYTHRGTNRYAIYLDPSEFWRGAWKENTNGWRTQLRVYKETNYEYPREGVMNPVSTNLMLVVEWGSPVKNSGGGYFMTPNGKFAKIELKDSRSNLISPNPDAGTNLLERTLDGYDGGLKLTYETNLPAWVSPANGSLVAKFPKTISTDVYPYFEYSNGYGKIRHQITGETGSVTNRPPFNIGFLKLDEIYSVTNEGDYTLTVQPVLYKMRVGTNLLDRVDLPSVTTKVHLVPNMK